MLGFVVGVEDDTLLRERPEALRVVFDVEAVDSADAPETWTTVPLETVKSFAGWTVATPDCSVVLSVIAGT